MDLPLERWAPSSLGGSVSSETLPLVMKVVLQRRDGGLLWCLTAC